MDLRLLTCPWDGIETPYFIDNVGWRRAKFHTEQGNFDGVWGAGRSIHAGLTGGTMLILIGPKVSGIEDAKGTLWFIDADLGGSRSPLSSVAVLKGDTRDATLEGDAEAVSSAMNANGRLKELGLGGVSALAEAAGIGAAVRVVMEENSSAISDFVELARTGNVSEHEQALAAKE